MENKIINDDATSILRTFDADSIDLIVTDPPYLGRYRDRSGRTLANDDNAPAVMSTYAEMYRVLKPDSYCVSFYGWTAIDKFAEAWSTAGFRTVGHIVWPKTYASKTRHTEYRHESAYVLTKGNPALPKQPISDVQCWSYSGNKAHPTEKTVEVIAPLIRSFSSPGDLVLDPFLGSGTTAVAAALNGRRAIGIELEERYCDLARKRLAGVESFQRQAQKQAA